MLIGRVEKRDLDRCRQALASWPLRTGRGGCMQEGLYESLVTSGLERQLAGLVDLVADRRDVDAEDQAHVLARHVRDAVWRALAATRNPEDRVALVNRILSDLRAHEDRLDDRPSQLVSLYRLAVPGATPPSARPATPLSEAALLTNAHDEPSLAAELRSEIDTADEVDLLCAFVKWHGLRLLEDQLRRVRDRGVPFRVVTTTYVGATERVALDRLVRQFGAQVKVQYDLERTRLHAKAWMFRRNTDFDTAYVGSSNLSRSALLEGVEWNVRLSKVATPALLQKFEGTFDTYWNDPAFEVYDPDRDRDRLDDALAEAGGHRTHERVTLALSGLQVRPYAHQREMLEELEVERAVHDRHRNLVVAATGTGKTVVAALDYQRLCDPRAGRRPSLLFVAHRREILEQSMRTYREVLSDANFGEKFVGGARPERWDHVFASVQSINAYGVRNIPADHFDIVVIDEFHHAEAATYRRLLDHLEPQELLGLTATPERADGTDVRAFFDGRTATELRLWEALGQDLLCPFHYFGIADGTDLSQVQWSRGRYDEQGLSNIYTGNDARARIVLKQLQDKVADISRMRALGFCVSVAHAEYMARVFTEAGIPARAVSGTTPALQRDQALADLREQRVNTLFAADLFNEGLDLPDVDTVLFLRPTESATIFLQQLGRGLRRARGKAVLTALDFVGHHRREFRFDARYRAMTGATRRGLEEQVERGFPFLPSGTQILLDRQTQESVLENIRAQVSSRWPRIVAELRSYGEHSLGSFLYESGVELADILRSGRSWTRLRREARLPTRSGAGREDQLLKRVRSLAHVDDVDRVRVYQRLLDGDAPAYSSLGLVEQRFARMLFFVLWPDGGGFASYDDGLAALRDEPAVRDEMRAVIDFAFDHTRHAGLRMDGPLTESPLRVHARYTREEIVAALDYASVEGRAANSFREGVLYARPWNTDAFLVTLRKSETDYSPTTMYRDYAISPTLFHWESQSTTSVESKTGRRYLDGQSNVLLFARDTKVDAFGTGAPYLFLGPGHYVSHTGDRPIAITWQLSHAMPTDVFTTASVAAG
jgi:superfamily II DNA or RNA helicase/HKD family nuclease